MQPAGRYFQSTSKTSTLSHKSALNPSQECSNGAENEIYFRDIRCALVPGNGLRGNHLYVHNFLSSSILRKLCCRDDAAGSPKVGPLLHTSLGGLRLGLLHWNPMVVYFNYASWLVTQTCMSMHIWRGEFAASLHSNALLPKHQFHPSIIAMPPCLSNVSPIISSDFMCY